MGRGWYVNVSSLSGFTFDLLKLCVFTIEITCYRRANYIDFIIILNKIKKMYMRMKNAYKSFKLFVYVFNDINFINNIYQAY